MTPLHLRIAILAAALAAGIGSSAMSAVAQTRPDQPIPTPEAYKASLPLDVYTETGNRFPKAQREELDDLGKKMFDALPANARGGPSSIRIYSPRVAEATGMENDYLRKRSGMDPQVREMAILVTVRELNSQYIWTSHEPQARQAGVPEKVIDVIKHHRPLVGLSEEEQVTIQLGREAVGKNKVSPEIFAHALQLWGRQGLVNVVSLMGNYAANAILLNTLDQQMNPGVTPRLPIP